MASYIYVIIMLNIKWIIEGSEINVARQALEYVFNVREGTCGAGTGDELPLQFDVTAWTEYADTAIRTANLLSKIIEINNGTLDSMTDETFFLLARNNVHGDSLIFGSAIGVEKGFYSGHEMFCPYAYKKNGTVRSHDLSLNYKYLDPDTEWYNSLKIKEWYHVNVVTDRITYREDDHQLPELKESYPIATLSDGHWTLPYFDCGGGNVWMVTYSSPIFRLEKGSILFRGVATIDIELTYMDINQCDGNKTDKSSGLDVFRGTHRCQSTTKCIHKKGKGFVSGAYSCECRKGYFFPDSNHPTQSYKGSEIESYLRRFGVIEPGMFQCSACTAGCVTCLNDSPCLHYHNTILSICLFSLTVMSVLGILTCAVFTYINRKNSVIRSACLTFLELMCFGGILICSQFFTSYFQSSVLVCTIRIWPQHIGFFILYGSLIIKTWRISQIFTVGARKRIHLPDKLLYKRFTVLLCATVAILCTWTLSDPPEALPLRTSDSLLFYVCHFGPWEYAVITVEILLLLYGAYLGFKIRKVPSQFNDKYMTYAIYNAIILGLFMTFLSRLLISGIGADLTLVFQFLQLQVFASVTLLILFIPKFKAIGNKKEANQTSTPDVSKISNTPKATLFNGKLSGSDYLNINLLKYLVEMSDKMTQTKWNMDEENIT